MEKLALTRILNRILTGFSQGDQRSLTQILAHFSRGLEALFHLGGPLRTGILPSGSKTSWRARSFASARSYRWDSPRSCSTRFWPVRTVRRDVWFSSPSDSVVGVVDQAGYTVAVFIDRFQDDHLFIQIPRLADPDRLREPSFVPDAVTLVGFDRPPPRSHIGSHFFEPLGVNTAGCQINPRCDRVRPFMIMSGDHPEQLIGAGVVGSVCTSRTSLYETRPSH